MSVTLEQELNELIKGSEDYFVRFSSTSYLHVYLYYRPAQRFHNGVCMEAGEFAHRLFGGPKRFRRAAKWIRHTVSDHQEMISSMGGVRIR